MSKTIQNVGSEDARAAVLAACMGLVKRAPWTGRTLAELKLEYTTDPIVAATNGRVLRINPDRFASYEPAEQIGILAHECLHVLFQHAARFPSPSYDHDRANQAADYAINGWLLGKGFELPGNALYDAQYDGMGAMAIYAQLRTSNEPPPQWGSFEEGAGPERPDFNALAEYVNVNAGLAELFASELGMHPRAHKLNLNRVLERLLIVDPVWHRDYRRPAQWSDDFPSWREHDERPRTVVGLDVSGSISREVREAFLGVLARVQVPVTVCAVDTAVRGVWRDIGAHNHARLCAELPQTGGGTRFQPAIDFAARERANLVYLTDGETTENVLARKGVPVVWLVWGDRPQRKVMAPVGKLIMVET